MTFTEIYIYIKAISKIILYEHVMSWNSTECKYGMESTGIDCKVI